MLSDHLKDSINTFGMRFASSKCKALLQDWIGSKSNIVFATEELSKVGAFSYFDI